MTKKYVPESSKEEGLIRTMCHSCWFWKLDGCHYNSDEKFRFPVDDCTEYVRGDTTKRKGA